MEGKTANVLPSAYNPPVPLQVHTLLKVMLLRSIQPFLLLASGLLSTVCCVIDIVAFYLPVSCTKPIYLCGLGWDLGPGTW